MKRKDVNEIAFETLQQAIGATPKKRAEQRKAEAAELGKRGGLRGGKARALALTKEQKTRIAKKAAEIRWAAKAKSED